MATGVFVIKLTVGHDAELELTKNRESLKNQRCCHGCMLLIE